LLTLAAPEQEVELALTLKEEEKQERDRKYWAPLKSELETLRRSR
jgi:hypothetical protein